jgi:tetratricopeptide (TPR) repeat protein
MKSAKIGLAIAISVGSVPIYYSQVPPPAPVPVATPSTVKLSDRLIKNLEGYDAKTGVAREKREQAYAKLLEAQRNIYRMLSQRTQAGATMYADLARASLVNSLEFDPGLSESYIALAEISILTSTDLNEAIVLTSISTKLNKDSIGGHKFLARLLTKRSGLRTMSIDPQISAKAIDEWKEVTRLDPRNAEAWALLSEFYERTDKTNESIDALRRWVSASSPLDSGWFRQIVGGRPEELSPEQAPMRLAAALVRAGRTREATDILSQQLSDDPDNTDVMAQIDEAIETAKPETRAAAIEPIKQIVLSHPGSLTLLAFFAGLDAKVGNVDEAVNMVQTTIDKLNASDRPAAANLQLTIGDVYASRDRFKDAASAYEKALVIRGLDNAQTLDPDEREFAMAVFDKLITAYKRLNRIDDAKSAILRARKLLGRDDIFADRELVSLYRETGDRSQALAVVRGVRSRNPEDISMLRLEATLLTEMGQVDNAVDLIKKRVETGKSDPIAGRTDEKRPAAPRLDDDFSNYIFISQLYSNAHRGAEAASAADKAFEIAGTEDRKQIARLMSATAKQTAGQFADAESILRDLLKQSPGNPIALNNLGYFLVERGEKLPEALDLIQRALAIDPTNPSYLDSLGWTYLKLGKTDDAIAKLEQAVRLDATSATIHEHLGDAYRKKGNFEQAKDAWRKAAIFMTNSPDIARVKEKLDNLK